MEYERYKPKRPRPFGMGPFFDYVLEVTKRLAAPLPRRKKTPATPQPEEPAEGR